MQVTTQSEFRDDIHPILVRLIEHGHLELIATLSRMDVATLTRFYENKFLYISFDELLSIDAACNVIEHGTNNSITSEY